jgi:hypothetical protein
MEVMPGMTYNISQLSGFRASLKHWWERSSWDLVDVLSKYDWDQERSGATSIEQPKSSLERHSNYIIERILIDATDCRSQGPVVASALLNRPDTKSRNWHAGGYQLNAESHLKDVGRWIMFLCAWQIPLKFERILFFRLGIISANSSEVWKFLTQ